MTERPILFSGPMVRAIAEGRKTVTRRPIKPAPIGIPAPPPAIAGGSWTWKGQPLLGRKAEMLSQCPYGQPGDRLWVRETFYAFGHWETRFSDKKGRDEWHFVDLTLESDQAYLYDEPEGWKRSQRAGAIPTWWRRPSIHMPRAASRILLELTAVSVERLQDISEEQALAEGVRGEQCDHARQACADIGCWGDTAKGAFGFLWESLNGAGSWAANPWVWVVEFKRVTP